MHESIEKTWGWDDAFQYDYFYKNLSLAGWNIVCNKDERECGYYTINRADHIYLRMLLVKLTYQKSGIGYFVLSNIVDKSFEKHLPVRLRVMKANQVKSFYQKIGFTQYDEDESFYKMEISP